MNSASYPYLNSNPLIEFFVRDVKNHWVRFLAYVDSGAALTILTKDDSSRLGFDLTDGERINLHGVSGSLAAYLHKTEVRIANTELKLKIAFSSSSKTPRLVGRKGLFDNFVVCFNDLQKEVTFTKIKLP